MANPFELQDDVAIVWLDNAPVNALSQGCRARLLGAIEAAAADPAVRALVLVGKGRGFSAGLDILEMERPQADPSLGRLARAIESCSKPVVAVLHGLALGGGLELAAAAHYRIAHKDTRLAMPDVKLGVPPGGGGTQRLPRLLGARTALDLMLGGGMRAASDPLMKPMIDARFANDPRVAGVSFARALLKAGRGPRPTCARTRHLGDRKAFLAEVARRKAEVSGRAEPAPLEIVEAVEAIALLTPEAALRKEADAFETCRASPAAVGLRHAFHAERRAVQGAQPEGAVPNLERIAVLGAGALAAQIVITLLNAGLSVSWGMLDLSQLTAARTRIRQVYDQTIAAGHLDRATRDARLARLSMGSSAEMARKVDLVIVAARGQASSADAGVPRLSALPGRVVGVGLRFQQPIPAGRLVEVIEGPGADDATLDAAFALVARLGRLPVHTVSHGLSISERMAAACHRAADTLVDSGLSPYEVDAALLGWGWRRPPFQLRDMAGLESTIALKRAPEGRNWSAPLVDMGRRGRGLGGGFYDYPPGEEPRPVRAVLETINRLREPRRRMTKTGAAELLVAGLANEGARILADGWASYASDIDIACIYGLDFPRWRGGPLMAADQIGLKRCLQLMDDFDHPDDAFWTPHPLLERLASEGRGFASMNG